MTLLFLDLDCKFFAVLLFLAFWQAYLSLDIIRFLISNRNDDPNCLSTECEADLKILSD